ncbi:hypothetical protein PG999_004757 [Apiospora kogelbergensis]|uniref:Uncharacterized protein n=1 Tax=Apiospora kogelbergensis TaxID=1337665 RepID=A0AAW0R077_9PEZI
MSDGEPAPQGIAAWFTSDDGPSGWRLDVVTLLAVIGESSIGDHAQTITASMVCLLPRIIPAPQAFLKSTRPTRMPETRAKMTGVYSGTTLESVGFFANILHPLDELEPFAFKKLRIEHVNRNDAGGLHVPKPAPGNRDIFSSVFNKRGRTDTGRSARTTRLPRPPAADDVESGTRAETSGRQSNGDVDSDVPIQGIARRPTMRQQIQDLVTDPSTMVNTNERPAIPASIYSPAHILSAFSFLLSIAIIVVAAIKEDGTAIFAVTFMSIVSSIVGIASSWKPVLMKRSHTNVVPKGDVVIRTREGAFILIECTEEVARELYAGTEECNYRVGPKMYRLLMGIGTFLLMVSVILLGNCKWHTQVMIGASYVVLNGMYWIMGLLPRGWFWDLSRYTCEDITPHDSKDDEHGVIGDPREGVPSFTRTLWYVIRETRRTAWVERSGAAPSTPQWKAWLAEAEEAAKSEKRDWKPVEHKDNIMKLSDSELEDRKRLQRSTAERDPAEQIAPATLVQPRNQGREPDQF